MQYFLTILFIWICLTACDDNSAMKKCQEHSSFDECFYILNN